MCMWENDRKMHEAKSVYLIKSESIYVQDTCMPMVNICRYKSISRSKNAKEVSKKVGVWVGRLKE
jgi:hypothetical protein